MLHRRESETAYSTAIMWLFALLGVGFLIGCLMMFINKEQIIEHGIRSIGTVTHIVESGGSRGETTQYYPFVLFEPENGEPIGFKGLGNSTPNYSIGEQVSVIYDPSNPHNALIESQISYKGRVVTFLGIIGVVCLFIAFGAYSYRRRKKRA